MTKKSPAQEVRERFGSKEALAKELMGKLERPYVDEDDEEFARRIRTTSNKKLLRLHAVYESVEKDFGSKDALVDAIMAMHSTGKPDLSYREKLNTMHLTRLLDVHRSHSRRAKARN